MGIMTESTICCSKIEQMEQLQAGCGVQLLENLDQDREAYGCAVCDNWSTYGGGFEGVGEAALG